MFQNNPQVRVAVLSITAAGAGITLTKSNVVVFAELYWTPGVSLGLVLDTISLTPVLDAHSS